MIVVDIKKKGFGYQTKHTLPDGLRMVAIVYRDGIYYACNYNHFDGPVRSGGFVPGENWRDVDDVVKDLFKEQARNILGIDVVAEFI